MLDAKTQGEALARLKKIEGQIRGVARMVEETKYCIEIVNQITAARRALEKVALLVMQQHMATCLTEAVTQQQGTPKIKELVRTLDQFLR
ncbi:MAG: metal-sensitive transcriptional regulator [Deltaproteobacteria bacterium]|nr:metal-sensitive transcriptional regulator [Deltaproteobacteria bacterium]